MPEPRVEPWDVHPAIAEVLRKHIPQETALGTVCGCGEIFRHPSAKAWHRHAAAMVVHALPARLTVERLAALCEEWTETENVAFTPERFATWLLPRLERP